MKKCLRITVTEDQNGFTIIETMIAIAIFAIGILAVAGMHIHALQGNEFSWERTEAVTLASQQLEELREQGNDDPDLDDTTSGSPHSLTDVGPNGQFDVEWTVSEDTSLETKAITMTVSWEERGTTRHAEFNYLIAKLDSYSM